MNVQPQSGNAQPTIRRPFDSIWWAKRGGLIVAVLVILVFGTELTLATQRRRDVTLTIQVQTAQVAIDVTPVATAAAQRDNAASGNSTEPSPTPTPIPAMITLAATDRLSVLVKWTYHIGPKFPHTTIYAKAVISGRTVSSGEVLIDCGTAIIDCAGQQPLTLAYIVPDTGSGASTVDWPSGDYLLTVSRSEGGLIPYEIGRYNFRVQ